MCFEIFGLRIEVGERARLFQRVLSRVGVGGVVISANLKLLSLARRGAIQGAHGSWDAIIPDGVSIKRLAGLSGNKTDTLAGVELGEWLISLGYSYAIIGGAPGVAERAAFWLSEKYGVQKAKFTASGYGCDIKALCELLRKHKPDICIVCLGMPKQELLIEDIKEASDSTVFLALGGSVDIYAGDVRRAPRWVRKIGAEWLWRMVREPRRVRELPELILTYLAATREVLNKKRKGRGEIFD